MKAALVIAGVLLVGFGFYKWVMSANKCPDCGEQMADVHGWPIMECRNCGKTIKWG